MKNGGQARIALEKWEEKHGQQSEILANEPKLEFFENTIWELYKVLSSARLYNMGGPQKIQISEIIYVARAAGLDSSEAVTLVTGMDNVWMEYYQVNKGK